MKSKNALYVVICLSLLIIVALLMVIYSNEKNKDAQLKEALSIQRIEYEKQLIAEKEQFEETLQQQRDAMENQSDREAEWIAKDIKVDEAVKNITTFLKVNVTYKDKIIGGVENVNVTVSNSSDFKMEQVAVKLSYLKKGTVYATQTVTIYELQPHASATVTAPDGSLGNSVT
ncbi:MAG: hypothetical protein WBB36_16360, partial [Chitinophagales bacterium]